MKFKIIPNERTPKANDILFQKDIKLKLFEKFLSFASRQHNCVGLAANQVSLNGERIRKPFFAIKYNHFWDIVLKPKILKYVGAGEEKKESCLTWIGKDIIVMRWLHIEVEYYNLKGEFIKENITGIKAQIFQHEYNHLMGVLENVQERLNNER